MTINNIKGCMAFYSNQWGKTSKQMYINEEIM